VRPFLEKNSSQKRTGGVAQGVGLEFKPQYHKNKTKPKNPNTFCMPGPVLSFPSALNLLRDVETPAQPKPG
jgi:hypothetical protein